MYLLIGCAVVVLALTVFVLGKVAARGGMPRSRRVQPHTREVRDLAAWEAAGAGDDIDLQAGRLGV